LRTVQLAQPSASASVGLGPQIGNLSSFGLDASGRLYAADIANGDVYRIDPDGNTATDPRCAPPPPPPPPAQHAPVNTSAPAIHGAPTPGAKLTCTPGGWSAATSFAYEWLRDGAPRAAGATYLARASDVGHRLSCRVTAGNAAGSSIAVSAALVVTRPAPGVSALRISPTAFRAAGSGPSDRKKGGRGATVTFRLDAAATVTFTVQRSRSGREINGHCRVGSRSHRNAKRCEIWTAVSGSFRITGNPGTNRFMFTGRIGGRKLDPGRYRLVARGHDAAGAHGRLARAGFSIR
jgi:hypothetical protein